MSDSELLEAMGTDAYKWTEEFMKIKKLLKESDLEAHESEEFGWMIGWFANAIEAGRSAGRREMEKTSE